jgi:hypothetical protein
LVKHSSLFGRNIIDEEKSCFITTILGEKVGEVGEADPGQSEVLEVDEGHGVAVQEGDVGGVDVEDVVRRLLDVQAFQVRAGVDLESMFQNLFFLSYCRSGIIVAGNP